MQVVRFWSLAGEAGIPQALQPKSQNMKHKQYGNTFNKDFKNGPHQKKKKKIEKNKKQNNKSFIYFFLEKGHGALLSEFL